MTNSDDEPNDARDRQWLSELYQIAHSDTRWAKEQGWRIGSWTFALLAAILALYKDPFSHEPPCLFVILDGAIVIPAIWFLVDLHRFAIEARKKSIEIEAKMPQLAEKLLPKRSQNPNHAPYLWVQIGCLVVAGVIAGVALTWLHASTP